MAPLNTERGLISSKQARSVCVRVCSLGETISSSSLPSGLIARWSFTPISEISWKEYRDDGGDKKIPTIEGFCFFLNVLSPVDQLPGVRLLGCLAKVIRHYLTQLGGGVWKIPPDENGNRAESCFLSVAAVMFFFLVSQWQRSVSSTDGGHLCITYFIANEDCIKKENKNLSKKQSVFFSGSFFNLCCFEK